MRQITQGASGEKLTIKLQTVAGVAVTGKVAADVTATYLKNDNTTGTITATGNWSEITAGAFSGKGIYRLTLPAAALDTPGAFTVEVSVSGAEDFTAEVEVVAKKAADVDTDVLTRASQTSVNAIPTNPLLTTDARLNNLDATIGSRAPASTAVSNVDLTAVRVAKLDNLDAAVTTRATPANVTAAQNAVIAALPAAPDNAGIAAIKAKTDNLPASPAAVGDVTAARDSIKGLSARDVTQVYDLAAAIPTNPATAANVNAARDAVIAVLPVAPDNAKIAAIDGRLPASPASETTLSALASVVALVRKILTNRRKLWSTGPDANRIVTYDDDNTTAIHKADTKDDAGNPATKKVVEKVPVP